MSLEIVVTLGIFVLIYAYLFNGMNPHEEF